eukprot:g14055.t1
MLAVDAVNPAVETPPVRGADSSEESSIESGEESDDGDGGGDSKTGSSSLAARAATLAPSPRLAAADRWESATPAFSSSRLSSSSSSWRSWGGLGGVGGSIVEEQSEAGEAASEHRPSYHCQICLDDQPAEAGFTLSACGHTFCRACLKAYVTSKVTDAQVYPTCFHVTERLHTVEDGDERRARRNDDDGDDGAVVATENGSATVTRGSELGRGEPGRGAAGRGGAGDKDGDRGRHGDEGKSCGVMVSPSDIKELLRGDVVTSRKYARFLFFREHKTARECPKCGKLSVGDPSVSLEIRCSGCGVVFCYEHGGAHEGRSCAEYVESIADETHRTMTLIGRMTKPCPGCGTPVEKLGGCNQMVCLHCNCSFCWICMEQVDRGTFPVHFQWWNVRGCPNQQLQEDVHQSTSRRRCLQALSVLQILVVGPFALLLTVASSLACFCCLPAFKLSPRQLFTGCISGWGNFIMVLPLIPLVCVGAVLAGVMYVIMLPYRLSKAMHRKWRFGRSGLGLPGPGRPGISGARSSSSSSSSSKSSSGGGGASCSPRRLPASAGGTASLPENGTIGATDVDVETRAVWAPPPATPVPSAAAVAEVLSDVLGPRQEQVLLDLREERQRQRNEEGWRGQKGEREAALPPRYPSPPSENGGGGNTGGGGGDGGVPSPSLTKESLVSPGSQPTASPRPPASSLELELAVLGQLGNSGRGRGSDSSGGGGGGGGGGDGHGDGQPAAPFASLGLRRMLGHWLGASPSPAAAVGAAVSGGAGASAAATGATVPPPRSRRNIAGAADEEKGSSSGEDLSPPKAEGGAFNSTVVFSPIAFLENEEAPPTSAAQKEGSVRDGGDHLV